MSTMMVLVSALLGRAVYGGRQFPPQQSIPSSAMTFSSFLGLLSFLGLGTLFLWPLACALLANMRAQRRTRAHTHANRAQGRNDEQRKGVAKEERRDTQCVCFLSFSKHSRARLGDTQQWPHDGNWRGTSRDTWKDCRVRRQAGKEGRGR